MNRKFWATVDAVKLAEGRALLLRDLAKVAAREYIAEFGKPRTLTSKLIPGASVPMDAVFDTIILLENMAAKADVEVQQIADGVVDKPGHRVRVKSTRRRLAPVVSRNSKQEIAS